ncbi:MAG: DUF192 domain-containing protein [Actinomycetota bacterium]|nr:DUF192 domain-containing protein [Actinomycetota bacterium]
MSRRALTWSLFVVVLLGACDGAGDRAGSSRSEETSAHPLPTHTFATGKVLIDTDDGSVLIDVEIAETEDERALGLMHRDSLAQDAGMLFVFFDDTTGGFWMKNTLIPLSIAFIDSDSKIVEILDMDPCAKDPCRIYTPSVPYRAALEVNQGAFDEWGVELGDRITVTR